MKKIKNENQYTGGKRNLEDERNPSLDNSRDGLKKRGLFRNGTGSYDFEDGEIRDNNGYRLRANRPESGEDRGKRYQPRAEQNINRSKVDSVKAEMRNRSRENYEQGKNGNRNDGRRSEERAENS